MRLTKIHLSLMAATLVALSSCKKENTETTDTYRVRKMSYATRVIDINLTAESDKINIPVMVETDRGAGWEVSTQPIGVGQVFLDSTSAIEYTHFAFLNTAPTKTEKDSDITYSYPIKVYPSRITEPVTITLVSNEFQKETRDERKAEVIDTLKINIYPLIK